MIAWTDEIINSIARRRSVLFLGAGVSMNSVNDQGNRPPSWREFLEKAVERCGTARKEMSQYLKSGDYLTCCQLVKYRMGHDWVPYIEEKFLIPQFRHARIHEAIFSLDSSIVLTPNFDKIYDNYAHRKTENLLKIKRFYEDDIPRTLRASGQQRLIIKVHGCIDTPDKLIFTREDYADSRHKHANFYRAIDALVFTHTFIFIGCGLNDPDLALILEQYARSFSASPPHYILIPRAISQEYKTLLEKNYNVKAISYSPHNNHQELTDSLVDLGKLVEARRENLAETRLW